MKLLSSLMLCFLLTACSSQQPIADVQIPANLTSPCEELEQLEGLTGKDLLVNITRNSAIYYRCRDKYDSLVEATKKNKK